MTQETKKFDAEIDKILHLMIHSLYTNKEIFLRELISNSSDACDKLRYLAQTDSSLKASDFKIQIEVDNKNKTISITDNGIGMNKEDLENNLGRIANSGTQKFAQALSGDKKKDNQLIGQFGVGFYSVFMVADKVIVYSKKAGEDNILKWQSEGKGSYIIESDLDQSEIDSSNLSYSGTKILLHIKDEAKDFVEKFRIQTIVKNYSDHIIVPIFFKDQENKDQENKEILINSSSALWRKNKSDISKEQYNDFYKNISYDGSDPWLTIHNKNEGAIEFTNLLYVPANRTFDLFHPDRKSRVKLYIKRVFIGDENIDIIPSYLRFLRGIIDSEDLPLNISRESLQHNSLLNKIKKAVTKKVLSDLKKQKDKNPEQYQLFWNNFGQAIKEGLCEADLDGNNEKLLEISMFNSSLENKQISLDEYIANIKEDNKNKSIYYICGDDINSLRNNPRIEGFRNKNIDVLLFSDAVDGFWVSNNSKYKDFDFKSITRSDIDLEGQNGSADKDVDNNEDKQDKNIEHKDLIEFFKKELKDKIKDVKIAKNLSSSPSCISTDGGSMDIRMERYLIEQKQLQQASLKIFEINIDHPVIKKIDEYRQDKDKTQQASDMANLIYDQSCIIENEPIDSPAFAKRLNAILAK
ncbi:MAG TPA: molecular chaperone HtpG [Candidatus Megaira endosymbiont of Hartmannula sinica]|nr:molecular chaperone HtpG [Candidatus Megaera endosymbiont of Hartmannula sinica]